MIIKKNGGGQCTSRGCVNNTLGNRPPENGPRNNGPRNNGPPENGPRNNGPRNNGPPENGPPENGPHNNSERKDLLFKSSDIASFYRPDNKFNKDIALPIINAKIAARSDSVIKNYNIQCNKFDTIYFTSDIHSDLRKFIQMLQFTKLINTTFDPYDGDSIYEPDNIANIRWTGGERVALVIIGDLVDGKRPYSHDFPPSLINSPDDPRGSFELLLLTMLFNIRIDANNQNSDVLFTIGNHDYLTVIQSTDDSYFHTKYVTDEVNKFFDKNGFFSTHIKNRKNALRPFYTICPFYLLSFNNNENLEIACVHGGLHNGTNDVTPALKRYQETIDSDINNFNNAFPFNMSGDMTPITARAHGKQNMCGTIASNPYKLIVVGHCITPDLYGYPRFKEIIDADPVSYAGCDGGTQAKPGNGCVLLDCMDHNGPKLAFVDIALSKGQQFPPTAYYPERPNNERKVQFLRASHDPALKDDNRYYNVIDRVTVDPSKPEMDDSSIMKMYAADIKDDVVSNNNSIMNLANLPNFSGGYKRKTKKNKKSKSKSKSKFKSRNKRHA